MPDVENDGGNSKHDDCVPTLHDEEDKDDELNQHTLRLASTIAIGSEILCLAFSNDGRCAKLEHNGNAAWIEL